jgi:hypothetical protein
MRNNESISCQKAVNFIFVTYSPWTDSQQDVIIYNISYYIVETRCPKN